MLTNCLSSNRMHTFLWPSFHKIAALRNPFPAALFIMFVIIMFESVGEILKCDHSNESY